MKIIVSFDRDHVPPRLSLFIHGAVQRRNEKIVLAAYKACLIDACEREEIVMPISEPIELYVCFIDPCSPDLGNLYLALEQALDGNSGTRPGVLKDDSLIHKVTMSKFFPHAMAARARRPMQLPKFSPMAAAS